MPELIWDGMEDVAGRRVSPLLLVLPFQPVEIVHESAQERQRSLFCAELDQTEWRNRRIWEDRKCVLPALTAELAGAVDRVDIDPPFVTGHDFSFSMSVDGGGLTTL